MALQELKDGWADYDRKLGASLRLNASLLRESGLSRTRSVLARLLYRVAAGLLLDLALVAVLGLFAAEHVDQLRFLIPALVLDLGAIVLVSRGAREALALKSLDYGAPVIAIQSQLEQIRIHRIRTTKWILLCVPLAWTPLLIVAMKGILGLDAYAILPGNWLAANLALGVAAVPLLLWISRRFTTRFAGSALLQRWLDDIAGRNLAAATGYLDQLARFEREG